MYSLTLLLVLATFLGGVFAGAGKISWDPSAVPDALFNAYTTRVYNLLSSNKVYLVQFREGYLTTLEEGYDAVSVFTGKIDGESAKPVTLVIMGKEGTFISVVILKPPSYPTEDFILSYGINKHNDKGVAIQEGREVAQAIAGAFFSALTDNIQS